VLLGENEGGLFLGVGGDDDGVVRFGVAESYQLCDSRVGRLLDDVGYLRCVNVALKKSAYSLLDNGVNASLLILVDLVETDVVLTIACVAKLRHGE
jgi:hypothetical protein